MWATSRALSARSFDVLLFPTVYSYVPVFSRARKILMIHDVIAETYPRLTTPGRAARWNWNLKVWLGRIQSDALVTVSNYSRRRIVEHFGVPADRVFVVGEAADPVFRRLDRPSLPAALRDSGIRPGPHTVVYVGGFGPHKNVDLLIDAFAACSSQPHLADAQLILVGERRKEVFHSAIDSIEALVRSYRIEDKTIFTGYLPDEDLAALLNLAGVLVLPSLMEGFGLPAVEAAACGCPVIATRESPLPELLGDGGIFITPRAADLRHALESLLSCDALRQRMGEAARQAAARLRWEDAARQMRDVIGRVMAP
jgi:glycosyltransferase involved in cell wall biosynthesis